MDPKLSNLDPKLQDAYNRVMSGPASAPSSGQSPLSGVSGAVPPPPAPVPAAPATPPPPPQSPNPSPVQPIATAPPTPQASSFGSTIAFNANNAGKNQGTTTIKKGGLKIMPIILGLGIIVLLIAYTFVWIYVFKLKIPFLPKF